MTTLLPKQNIQLVEIKKLYPNFPDETLVYIIKNIHQLSDRDIYMKLRYAEKPYICDEKLFQQASAYASHGNENIEEWDSCSVYNYREARGVHIRDAHTKINWHLAFNVRMEKILIQDLDKILIEDNGKNIWAYKFLACNYEQYSRRYDPIVMYMYNHNKETEQKIADVAMPYARSNDGLIGKILGPGVAICVETSNRAKYNFDSVGMVAAKRIKQILCKKY